MERTPTHLRDKSLPVADDEADIRAVTEEVQRVADGQGQVGKATSAFDVDAPDRQAVASEQAEFRVFPLLLAQCRCAFGALSVSVGVEVKLR